MLIGNVMRFMWDRYGPRTFDPDLSVKLFRQHQVRSRPTQRGDASHLDLTSHSRESDPDSCITSAT